MANHPYGSTKSAKKQQHYSDADQQQLDSVRNRDLSDFQKQDPLKEPTADASRLPQESALLDSLGKIAYTLDKTYLTQLSACYGIFPFEEYYNKCELPYKDENGEDAAELAETITYASNIRALQVSQWVYDKDEKIGDCFKNVLSVFAGSDETVAMVLHRTEDGTKMYFVTKNAGPQPGERIDNAIGLLASTLRGNFPGSVLEPLEENKNAEKDLKNLFSFQDMKAVSCLCNIPSERGEGEYLCQGIDKLLNSLVPGTETIPDKEYYIIFMATPLSAGEQREVLQGYEELATALAPFAGYQFQRGRNEAHMQGEMNSLAQTNGISEAVTKTHSINAGLNAGLNGSFSTLLSKAVTTGISAATTWGTGASASVEAGAAVLKGSATVSEHQDFTVGGHVDNTSTSGKQTTYGGSVGMSLGYGYSWGRTEGRNASASQTVGTNRGISLGITDNTTYTYKSYLVSDLLKKLEAMITRITESQAMGLWKTASYVLAENTVTSQSVAHYLRSLLQGDNSYLEPAVVQTWTDEESQGIVPFKEIREYLSHFTHPVFLSVTEENVAAAKENNSGNPIAYDPANNIFVTPTANVSTAELANAFAFPRYSVQGIPVIQCARFGREPHSLQEIKRDIRLGCAYHMHHPEEQNKIGLDKNELTAHTFITGSTGAGKSNTIYKIIDELCFNTQQNPVHFLVIEPAKGEYKKSFSKSKYKGISVYGTNPKKTDLLQINPFSFPDDIHVLEHIDRLVEVFNACWPMYAAMPAVLKDAIEASYVSCGWSLTRSVCTPKRFPTFATVLKKLPEIMDSSAYSKDTKGDYTGALVTRVKSLTNGINGQIFCSDNEICDKCLFDHNVIIDLSRVGSMETKALLMGILMIKLQEYRMATAEGSNAELKHITVLEEAHNLLRRTSTEQSQEGSNLQGKSVEMLANAIAEMRTYGEGFIIADQAPGLLDMAVIRNTNTKIIMRLPDESDRELVGKAAGLNDDQIVELARLDRGVAAVFQNHWLEPVLCMVDKFEGGQKFEYPQPKQLQNPDTEALFSRILTGTKDGSELSQECVDRLNAWIDRQDTGREAKEILRKAVEQPDAVSDQEVSYLLYCLVKGKTLVAQAEKTTDPVAARAMVEQTVMDVLQVSDGLAARIRELIFVYAAEQVKDDEARFRDLLYYGGVK